MKKIIDLTNKKFGKIIVKKINFKKNGHIYWLCECKCGKKFSARGDVLKFKKNCRDCSIYNSAQKHIIHKMSGTQFYNIYYLIIKRCYNKNDISYKYYGARGIKCLWKNFNDFKNDMYKSYSKHCEQFGKDNTSIDRINNRELFYLFPNLIL